MIRLTQIQKQKSPFLLRIIDRPICKCRTKPSLSPPPEFPGLVSRGSESTKGVHTAKAFSSTIDTDLVEDAAPQLFHLIIAAKSWMIW